MVRKTSGSIRGYLFGVVIRSLLGKSGLEMIQPGAENKLSVRRMRNDIIELRGRGCWHAVDCPYMTAETAPFMPPVRMVGMVRYHMSEMKKESIRNFVGILTDLEEGRYLLDAQGNGITNTSRMDVGVFFAANGFLPEAERMAYSHGIRTVSYKENRQMEKIKQLIFELESKYLDYDAVMQQGNFIPQFTQVLNGTMGAEQFVGLYGLSGASTAVIESLREEVQKIQTSFFASTATGMMMHFLSEEEFPEELFADTDTAVCSVKLEPGQDRVHAYYLQFEQDEKGRRFYFAPPEAMQEQILYGGEQNQGNQRKKKHTLCAEMKINGINRKICLIMEPDWRSALAF